MLSQAGKQYQRSKRIKSLQKAQRERVYKSFSLTISKRLGHKKFSPFNTISRDSRNSYLLRVTKEPNPNTLYQPKYSQTKHLHSRPTIDHAKFQRMIGEVKNEDYSTKIDESEKKCMKSLQNTSHQPLTVRQTHNWRKTLQHFDFNKQEKSKRLDLPSKLSFQQSTRSDFMALATTTESNFNNFKRFGLKPQVHNVHKFDSDFGHKHFSEKGSPSKSPQYDIQSSNESFIHRSMPKIKGEERFYLYKDQIATRHDRADKSWHTILAYDSDTKPRVHNAIVFDQIIGRQDNEVHSKYPIRLSLSKPLRVRD